MTRLAAVLSLLAASQAWSAEYPRTARQGGDTLELRQGEVFVELVYENSADTNSGGGTAYLELNGIVVVAHVQVLGDERLTVKVKTVGLFAEIETIDVADGERAVVRILPALF